MGYSLIFIAAGVWGLFCWGFAIPTPVGVCGGLIVGGMAGFIGAHIDNR